VFVTGVAFTVAIFEKNIFKKSYLVVVGHVQIRVFVKNTVEIIIK